jgi:hypothetical protein
VAQAMKVFYLFIQDLQEREVMSFIETQDMESSGLGEE